MRAALTWVKSNCTNPGAARDLTRFVLDSNAKGVNCWFVAGGGLIRSGNAVLVHSFAGELFVFELTAAQAATCGIGNNQMTTGSNPASTVCLPKNVMISLEHLEVPNPTITSTTPIDGRVHYEVLADVNGPWCVALDCDLGGVHHRAWHYPRNSLLLRGKGMLDVSFPPLAPAAGAAANFRGPLALLVRICAVPDPTRPEPRPPISNATGTLIEVA